jgi:bacteriocin biosynthesis cyclodehydratase domain-containing protein
MPRFLQDRNLRFPRRPRLAPDLALFAMPDGLGYQVRGGEADVLIRGAVAERVLPWLLGALDGKATGEEILAARPPGVSEADASDALLLLLRKGLLVDADAAGADAPAPADPVVARQQLFFGRKLGVTRLQPSGEAAQRALAEARIVLVGDGLFGAAAFDLLQRSGCRHLSPLDWEGGGLLSEAVRSSPLAGDGGEAESLGRDLDRLGAALATRLPASDLVVTATRNAPDAFFRLVNERALLERRRWLRGDETSSAIEIGPFVNGLDSPCYTCLLLRLRGAAAFPVEDQLQQQELERAGPQGLAGEALAHATAGAALLAAEAVRIVTRIAPPWTAGAVISLGFERGFERHAFARVPRCPDCHRGDVVTRGSGD